MIRAVVSGGSAASPAIDVQPATLDFGNVNVGATTDRTLTVRNTGSAPLNVTGIISSNGRFSVTSATSFSVAPNAQQTVTVRFNPTAAGSQTGTLSIASNDPARAAVTVQLRGEGVNAQPACPTVTDLNPRSGAVGSPVAITGSNFGGVTSVSFSGNVAAAPNINAAGTQIAVTVPNGAMSGPLSISKSGCQPVTTPPFTVSTTQPADRVVRVVDASGSPGAVVRVPITIQAQGDEVGIQFSLRFDPALLANPQAEAGSDATSNRFFEVNKTQIGQGHLGVIVLLRDTLARGTRQVAVVSFQVAASARESIPISFDDSPTRKRVIDVNTRSLDAAYVAGAVTFGQGFEGDVNDDKVMDIADAQLIINHLVGRRTIQPGPEFQRADCAPKENKGDGRIEVDDALQVILYNVGNELVPAGGPSAPQAAAASLDPLQTQARSVRIAQDGLDEGGHSFVVMLDGGGGESALSFSLRFDPRRLRFAGVVAGEDARGAIVAVNSTQLAEGRVGLALVLPAGEQFAAGARAALRLSFIAVDGVIAPVSFGDEPIARRVVDGKAGGLQAVFADGEVVIRPGGLATVSAADYREGAVARGSVVTSFGAGLAVATQTAEGLPLPTALAGTTLRLIDSQGVEHPAPLFFVSPGQINYLIPPEAVEGPATVVITSVDDHVSTGLVQIAAVAPGLFTAGASGQGLAAAVALRVHADGRISHEALARFDASLGRFVAAPLDLSAENEDVYLSLFGTGWRHRRPDAPVKVMIDGVEADALYAGAQGDQVGLDQINVRVPRVLKGRGMVTLTVMVDGQVANVVTLDIR